MKPEGISWDTLQKVDPHREEPLLGRNAHSARYREPIPDRTGQPVSENLQEQAHFENFVMGSDATEFVNIVRDQVRIRQKRMSNVAESGDEHSIIWGIFMATTLNAATFMGKNFSTIQSVVKNHESLTLKQMFDVTPQLVNNQEEIYCLDQIIYQKNSWTHLSFIVRIVFNFSEPRGRNILEIKIHRNQLLEKIDQGNLAKKQIYSKPLIITTMSNPWKASLQQIFENWITTVLGLLKSGKLRLRRKT